MERQKSASIIIPPARLWLAAEGGRTLTCDGEPIGAADEPEAILDVEFEGLTEAEQRAALDAFPGGRRFRLAAARH